MQEDQPPFAFPLGDHHEEYGMTLRDYFAARAMNGFLAKYGTGLSAMAPAILSKMAYEIADAMLKARKQ